MDIQKFVSEAVDEIHKELDNYLISVFGSRERFEAVADNYVLEYFPVEVTSWKSDYSFTSDEVTCQLVHKYRLRLKTKEEKDQERTDAILKRNSSQGTCISCGEEIMGNQEMITTIHGPYHGGRRDCIEGREFKNMN